MVENELLLEFKLIFWKGFGHYGIESMLIVHVCVMYGTNDVLQILNYVCKARYSFDSRRYWVFGMLPTDYAWSTGCCGHCWWCGTWCAWAHDSWHRNTSHMLIIRYKIKPHLNLLCTKCNIFYLKNGNVSYFYLTNMTRTLTSLQKYEMCGKKGYHVTKLSL